MKIYFCALSVVMFAMCIHGQSISEILKSVDKCQKEHKSVKDFSKLDFDDPEVQCFLACTFKDLDFMENGKILSDKLLKSAQKLIPFFSKTRSKSLTDCVSSANQQTDECAVAGDLGKCINKK